MQHSRCGSGSSEQSDHHVQSVVDAEIALSVPEVLSYATGEFAHCGHSASNSDVTTGPLVSGSSSWIHSLTSRASQTRTGRSRWESTTAHITAHWTRNRALATGTTAIEPAPSEATRADALATFSVRVSHRLRITFDQRSISVVFEALVDRTALETWLPPDDMTARFERFDPTPGGSYRLLLTYSDASESRGKSTSNADFVEVRFAALKM